MDGKTKHPLGFNQRIAIVGAGATGLTAAESLKQKGYQHVTLFESTDHAGGKCLSIDIDSKSYELGAGVLTIDNEVPLRLAKKYHIPLERVVYGNNLYVDQDGKPMPIWSFLRQFRILWQLLFRYRPLLNKYKEIESPGFLNLHPEITVPFKQFAKENKITELANLFNLYLTGFGYCYTNHVPTAYVLKYANWKTICAYLRKKVYIFPNGIQTLWTRIAEGHDVRYNAMICDIVREDHSVVIETGSGKETFDSLILTTPLDEVERFMAITEEEKSLFKHIVTLDYQTILCSLKGFPRKGGFVPGNFSRRRAGHPVFWYYRQPDSNIFSFYVLADKTMDRKVILQNLKDFVGKLGGEIEEVLQYIDWKYFPHVGSDPLREGFYERMEQIQGQNHTYYMGELLNFSCIGFTCRYAEDLVNRYF